MNANSSRPILYLDCFSGLSGDMIVSALLDLGIPFSIIEKSVSALPLSGYTIAHKKEIRNAIAVSRFFVELEEKQQPHRHFFHIRDMIEKSSLNHQVKHIAVAIFEVLAKAEAKVHGTTVERVHFHEVGAVDSIIDIVSAAAAFDYLNANVVCARVPLGRGFVNTQHGLLPLPAPATLNILEGVPVEGTEVDAELTTPTGAAIVKTLVSHFGPIPSMAAIRVGFGAGSRALPERPGILRAVLGENHASPRTASSQIADTSKRKLLLIIFDNAPCKRNHAFIHALDLAQHGHTVKIILEGEATRSLAEREGIFGDLFASAEAQGIIAGVCETAAVGCSSGDPTRNVVELAKQQNISLIGGKSGHADIGQYVSDGFELITY